MENREEIMLMLEKFSKQKEKSIPREFDDYLAYVAKTGDPVFRWSLVKTLFREKLDIVITEFHQSTSEGDLPSDHNGEPFHYEQTKTRFLNRLDKFASAPFTIQRLCELLTSSRKEYKRTDKYMRAIEKCISVTSTCEPKSSDCRSKPIGSNNKHSKGCVGLNKKDEDRQKGNDDNNSSERESRSDTEKPKTVRDSGVPDDGKSKYIIIDYIDLTGDYVEIFPEIKVIKNRNFKLFEEKDAQVLVEIVDLEANTTTDKEILVLEGESLSGNITDDEKRLTPAEETKDDQRCETHEEKMDID